MTRSSANIAFDIFSCSAKSLIYMRKSVQLRDDPWGRSSSNVRFDDVAPLYLVAIVLLLRKAWIQLNIHPWIPILSIFTRRPFLHTLSYACCRSTNTPKVCFPSLNPCNVLWTSLKSWSSARHPRRKPACLSVRSCLFSSQQ